MRKNLTLTLQSYWHAGSGRTSGSHVDRLVEKDNGGLPFVSGKHLKGLLRNAIMRAEHWQWFTFADDEGSLEERLFGSRSGDDDLSRYSTVPGLLMISDARLPEPERQFLSGQTADSVAMRSALYRNLFSTAIKHKSGTAKKHSLRGMEVVVPVTLVGELSIEHEDAERLFEQLRECLPLIDSVGAKRNRGLGQATLELEYVL